MSYQVKVEKLIDRTAADIFAALKSGLLFMNCGADSNEMKIDFRVGGNYEIHFRNKSLVNFGEFIEIVADQKIVFTWCQTFGPDQKPDTKVSIDLLADGSKTRMVLLHTGFATEEIKKAHEGGWCGGVDGFTNQIQNGELRMLRAYETSADKLFSLIKSPEILFAYLGKRPASRIDFSEVELNKKVAFAWPAQTGSLTESNVTLNIAQRDDGTSTLEIVHQDLHGLDAQQAQRSTWERATKEIRKALAT